MYSAFVAGGYFKYPTSRKFCREVGRRGREIFTIEDATQSLNSVLQQTITRNGFSVAATDMCSSSLGAVAKLRSLYRGSTMTFEKFTLFSKLQPFEIIIGGGYNALFPFLNSFVHVIMYGYYGVAALGEKYKKYLVWKKYMTYLQLAQFVCVLVYAVSLIVNKCNISKAFIAMNFIHALLFLGLFLNFFIQNYTRKSNAKPNPTLASSEKARLYSKNHSIPPGIEAIDPKTIQETSESGFTKQTVSEIELFNYRVKIHKCIKEEDCKLSCRSPVQNSTENFTTESISQNGYPEQIKEKAQ
ncbi:UNVERIFIED_CONTAM: Elongation of very long chain fatty acids protein [Trichonephila clavipes]